ncbi:hypothetical protein ACFQJD_03590 [Haloplanus sp. GCM10025708]|uniref:hypothetical protein n=1 Tax=Haloplanus sp. GCM10025708 TaxID=3252679 RepID=UPI0036214A47
MRTYIAPIGYNSTSVTRPVILSRGVEEEIRSSYFGLQVLRMPAQLKRLTMSRDYFRK